MEQETKEPAIGKEQATGKNPTRAAAAKLMWAKRKASGTNGRYGGKPTERTVAKAKKMMKGEEEGV